MAKPMLKGFLGRDIEPKALCANCEYFDGGGLTAEGYPRHANGDCLNSASPRFTTTIDNTCVQFFPCSSRWPDADHG